MPYGRSLRRCDAHGPSVKPRYFAAKPLRISANPAEAFVWLRSAKRHVRVEEHEYYNRLLRYNSATEMDFIL